MNNRIKTPYIHAKKGWPVVISQGIGGIMWSVYLVKPSGSLQRCKQFGGYVIQENVSESLIGYITEGGKSIVEKCWFKGCKKSAKGFHCKSCNARVCKEHQAEDGYGNHGGLKGDITIGKNEEWGKI